MGSFPRRRQLRAPAHSLNGTRGEPSQDASNASNQYQDYHKSGNSYCGDVRHDDENRGHGYYDGGVGNRYRNGGGRASHYNSYLSGSRNYRSQPPPPSHSSRPPAGDFLFRVDKPAGIGRSYESHRPSSELPWRLGDASRLLTSPCRADHGPRYRDHASIRRGPLQRMKKKAADRDFITSSTSNVPETNYFDAEAGASFRPLDELSESEQDMDISDDDKDNGGTGERLSKRARLSTASVASVPKWSNPDPYTAAPPADSAGYNKKKDPVHLIRKARVQTAESRAALVQTDDFIALDSDEEKIEEEVNLPERVAPAAAPSSNGKVRWVDKEFPMPAASNRYPVDLTNDSDSLRRPVAISALPSPSAALTALPSASSMRAPWTVPDSFTFHLGSRKRTHDDQIKVPPHAKLIKVNKKSMNGAVMSEWRRKPGIDPHPWLVHHAQCETPAMRLHREVVDFYDFIKPRDFEQRMREEVVDELRRAVRGGIWHDANAYPFGSFPSGLYLPHGDLDLVIVSDRNRDRQAGPKYDKKSHLFKFRAALERFGLAHNNDVELVIGAKVPLVKYIERKSGLKMDISFENTGGLQAIKTFQAWKDQYPAIPILVMVVKHFLQMRGLNEPVSGGIGGFSTICLVVSMLQLMPAVQSRSMDPRHHLGELLLYFFDLYGNRFNYVTTAISLNPPKLIPKNNIQTVVYRNKDRLSIIDPNNAENDIACGSSNTRIVMKEFARARHNLQKRMAELAQAPGEASILEVILGGDYTIPLDQRNHLGHLAQRGGLKCATVWEPRGPRW